MVWLRTLHLQYFQVADLHRRSSHKNSNFSWSNFHARDPVSFWRLCCAEAKPENKPVSRHYTVSQRIYGCLHGYNAAATNMKVLLFSCYKQSWYEKVVLTVGPSASSICQNKQGNLSFCKCVYREQNDIKTAI